MIYLTLEELLFVAERVLGAPAELRDRGLLASAVARPQATVFGADAYPSIHDKAGALLHSIARNHALVDGNERLALASVIAFYGMNGLRLTLSNDEAFDLVMEGATGAIDEVGVIASRLEPRTELRRVGGIG